jgi:hypothetical protein
VAWLYICQCEISIIHNYTVTYRDACGLLIVYSARNHSVSISVKEAVLMKNGREDGAVLSTRDGLLLGFQIIRTGKEKSSIF